MLTRSLESTIPSGVMAKLEDPQTRSWENHRTKSHPDAAIRHHPTFSGHDDYGRRCVPQGGRHQCRSCSGNH